MKKVLAFGFISMLMLTGTAAALEVRAPAGEKVIVFGLAKSNAACKQVNGNQICPPVEIVTATVPGTGVLQVALSGAQKSASKQICAKIYGSLDNPVCGKPTTRMLTIR